LRSRPCRTPARCRAGGAAGIDPPRSLFLVSIKDQVGATAWFRELATTGGSTLADETYNGATITTASGPGGSAQGALAVLDGKVAVVGDLASVKAAIDTRGKGPFADRPTVKSALDATDSDHVGFVYVDTASLVDWAAKLSQQGGASITPGLDLSSSGLRDLIPDWEGFALRVEGDAVVLETAVDRPSTSVGPSDNRATKVTEHVPGSALLVGVGHDVGATLIATLGRYSSEPSMKSVTDAIGQAAGIVGGVDGAVGWAGDAGFVLNQADGGVEGGVRHLALRPGRGRAHVHRCAILARSWWRTGRCQRQGRAVRGDDDHHDRPR